MSERTLQRSFGCGECGAVSSVIDARMPGRRTGVAAGRSGPISVAGYEVKQTEFEGAGRSAYVDDPDAA